MDLRVYLKNLPAGTTLYSLVEGPVNFRSVTNDKIIVLDHNHCIQEYHFSGRLYGSGLDGECLLFPSKKLRDWDLFTKFKKGDIIVDDIGIIAIFDHLQNGDVIVYNAIRRTNGTIVVKTDTGIGYASYARLATKEEKDLFFNSLSEAGYSWNGVEVVPIFKKGDIVVSAGGCIAIVDHIGEFGSFNNVIHYQCCLDPYGDLIIKTDVGIGHTCDCKYAPTYDQERILKKLHEQGYVLDGDTVVKKKFNPKTLEHFQKVLVRDSCSQCWCGDFFQYMEGSRFVCTSSDWTFCIPYNDDTKHLVGNKMPAPEFYRNRSRQESSKQD